MKKFTLCTLASLFAAPAFAQEKKPSAQITGFIALDVFKWVKKEGSREEMNVGIGTLNLDARTRNGGTSLKFKLDLDANLMRNPNSIFEEATVTQDITDSLAFTAGKGVVPFHQKHYGVIKDSYFDGGTVVGNYDWNYGDQDRRYLLSSSYKLGNIKNSVTFFAEGAYQPTSSGAWVTSSDTKNSRNEYEDMKGIDPRDQRGIADKIEVKLSQEFTVAAAALYTWHKLDPHTNYAAVTSGRFEIPDTIEAWYEFQYGYSSSYRYNFKKKKELLGQVGADYTIPGFPMFSVLANLESANFTYLKNYKDASKTVSIEGLVSKLEAGIATHFSEKATWTNGYMYETGEISDNGVKRTKGRTAEQFTSTFTFSF